MGSGIKETFNSDTLFACGSSASIRPSDPVYDRSGADEKLLRAVKPDQRQLAIAFLRGSDREAGGEAVFWPP
jgi:hypothetical protein